LTSSSSSIDSSLLVTYVWPFLRIILLIILLRIDFWSSDSDSSETSTSFEEETLISSSFSTGSSPLVIHVWPFLWIILLIILLLIDFSSPKLDSSETSISLGVDETLISSPSSIGSSLSVTYVWPFLRIILLIILLRIDFWSSDSDSSETITSFGEEETSISSSSSIGSSFSVTIVWPFLRIILLIILLRIGFRSSDSDSSETSTSFGEETLISSSFSTGSSPLVIHVWPFLWIILLIILLLIDFSSPKLDSSETSISLGVDETLISSPSSIGSSLSVTYAWLFLRIILLIILLRIGFW